MKIAKSQLKQLILEETINFLEESYTSAADSGDKTVIPFTQGLQNILASALKDLIDENDKIKQEISAIKQQISTIKQQIPGLERTVKLSAAGIPVLPPKDPTMNIQKVAENKKTIKTISLQELLK